MEVKKNIIRYMGMSLSTLRLLLTLSRLWGVGPTVRFFISKKPEQSVSLKGLNFAIRSASFKLKLVDICMITECVIYRNYTPSADFEIGKDDTIIDIGGHVGGFAVFAAKSAQNGKTYVYEPAIANFDQLAKNVKLNNLQNVSVFNKAVAGKKGTINLYIDSMNNASNSVYKKSKDFVAVEALSLNDIFSKNRIRRCDFLKIDCEGAEYDILFNADKAILGKIQRIACEYHNPKYFGITDQNFDLPKLVEYLKNAGFVVQTKRVNAYQGLLFAKR